MYLSIKVYSEIDTLNIEAFLVLLATLIDVSFIFSKGKTDSVLVILCILG